MPKVLRLHTPTSAPSPGAAPVALLGDRGVHLCFAAAQRRSSSDRLAGWVLTSAPARWRRPTPTPSRAHVPLGRSRRARVHRANRLHWSRADDPPHGCLPGRTAARSMPAGRAGRDGRFMSERDRTRSRCHRLLGGERRPWRPCAYWAPHSGAAPMPRRRRSHGGRGARRGAARPAGATGSRSPGGADALHGLRWASFR